jgi:glucosamine--fructose-6-phosphate aminotransferase (isomerizing)
MNSPLLENIRAQPNALRQVADYQLGPGRDALLRSAELIRSGKRVILSGMGASAFACVPLAYALGAEVVDSSELLYFRSSILELESTVLLVSRSGESVEVIKLLPVLRQAGCRVIGVTNVPGSTLATQANEAIFLNSPADQLVAIQTYTATVLALLLLAHPKREDMHAAIERFESWLNTWIRAADSWQEFVNANTPVYLLGRGPALGSVSEGALLFHEMAKSPAVGMQTAQFRHGPVEVVDAGFRGIVFGTTADTLELDSALAQDLLRMGAKICWIGSGPAAPAGAGANLIVCDVSPDRFAPLLEIIPCQLLAYRMTEARGVKPGEFRWAPAITRSETGFAFADSPWPPISGAGTGQ